jgi:hypothetical protein
MPDEGVLLDSESFDVLVKTLNTIQDQITALNGDPARRKVVPQVGMGPTPVTFKVTSNKAGSYWPAILTFRIPDATAPNDWYDLTAVRALPMNDEKAEVGRRYQGMLTGYTTTDGSSVYPVVIFGGDNSAISIDVPISFDVNPGPPCTLTVREYRRYYIRAGFIEIVSTTVIPGP